MKFDLNVSIKVSFIVNDLGLEIKNQRNYSFPLKVLLFIF